MSLRTSPQTGVAISFGPGDCHVASLLAMTAKLSPKTKIAHIEAFDVCCIESSSFVCRRIWHLSFLHQVAGFHRAGPSTALDKAVCNFLVYSTDFPGKVNTFFELL